MTNLRSLSDLFKAAMKLAAACAFTTAIATAAAGQTNTFPTSGNVGIGTTNPSAKLQIQQDVNGDNSIYVLNNGGGTLSRSLILFGEANSDAKYAYFGHFGANYAGSGPAQPRSTLFVGADAGGFNLVSYGGASQTGGKVSFWTSPDAAGGGNAAVAERMRITSNGNVGIGTTSPSYRLQVRSVNGQSLFGDPTGNQLFYQIRPDAGKQGWLAFTEDNVADRWAIGIRNGDSKLYFSTGNIGALTDRMNLDATGNLTVGGSLNASGGLCMAGDCKTSWAQVGGGGSSQWSGTNPGPIYYNGGNVGIGTTSPTTAAGYTALSLNNTTGTLIDFMTSNALKARLQSDGTTFYFNNLANGPIQIYTNSTERMRIDSSGNVGIGTTSPIYSLDVNGGVNGFRTKAATTSSGDAIVTLENAAGVQAIVRGNGYLGLGIPNPTEKLHVVGNGKFTGNLTVDGSINAKYQDLAEWVPSSEQLSAGTVVVLDTTKSNQVIASGTAYDTRVAGVISAQPGITLGESGEGKVLVATTGRVRVKVDASRGAIQIGDLLVTSDVAGVAMKSEAVEFAGRKMHMPGTIIGKALEPLAKGSGEILVLLSLQ